MHTTIDRRKFLALLGSGLAAMMLPGLSCSRNVMTPPPNIVLIYTDDQGYGDVSALNPEAKVQTPHIDRLVHEGLTFTDGHAPDTVCTPSRYGLLTGRYSWRTRLKQGVMGAEGACLIPDGRLTLPSLLQQQGYHTAMIGKWHLGMQFAGDKGENRDWNQPVLDGPVEKGFDYFYGIPASMNYGVLTYIENRRVTEPPVLWTAKKHNRHAINDYRIMPPYEEDSDLNEFDYLNRIPLEVASDFKDSEVISIITDTAIDWLDSVNGNSDRETPFFLYLPYTSPHKPVCPTERFQGKSDAGWYGDFIMETDYHVGRILERLDRHGVAENTMVIFTSDNGPETTYRRRKDMHQHSSNGQLKGGKRDLYEGGHRVPFLIRWPEKIRAGRRCDEPVCQTDLLATFADILGQDIPADAGEDSFSLLPALVSDNFPRPLRGPIIHHSSQGYFAIREGRWKLNMIRGSGGSLQPAFREPDPGEPPYELYDLQTDLNETTNVYGDHPDIVQSLEKSISDIVIRGRSTPVPRQQNDCPQWWAQLTWMDEPQE